MEAVDTTEKSSNTLSQALVKKKQKILTTEQARAMAEKSKESPKHGTHGKRKSTLLKEEVYKQIQQKLMERSLGLINTQTILAHGAIKIFKVVTTTIGKGKNEKKFREKPVLVKDDDEIIAVIDYEFGDGDSPNSDDEFFFVVTQDPDNGAIRDQLNRVFGKPDAKVDLTSKGREIKTITIMAPSNE